MPQAFSRLMIWRSLKMGQTIAEASWRAIPTSPALRPRHGRPHLQIMNLLNLASDIQEEILHLPRTEKGLTRLSSCNCSRSHRHQIGESNGDLAAGIAAVKHTSKNLILPT